MKLDALNDLVVFLETHEGHSDVSMCIAGFFRQFVADNTPPTLATVSQDAIDAARYRKLRAAHLNLRSRFVIRDSNGWAATLDGASFDAWVDALPS